MGLYINGLKLPEDNHVRVLVLRCDGRCVDEFGNTFSVVPVPPHGRCIDADALTKKIKRDGIASDPFVKIVCDYFKDAPTIIPAEPNEDQHEYEAYAETAQYCELYEPTYDKSTGAL